MKNINLKDFIILIIVIFFIVGFKQNSINKSNLKLTQKNNKTSIADSKKISISQSKTKTIYYSEPKQESIKPYDLLERSSLLHSTIHNYIDEKTDNSKTDKKVFGKVYEPFEITLYTNKKKYKITDAVKIWATLKYIGSKKTIKVSAIDPYITIILTDGKTFNVGGLVSTVLTYSTVEYKKNQAIRYNFQKNGGYSADDPKASYWKKFFKEKDLYLPEGKYSIEIGCSLANEKSVNLESFKSMKLNISVVQ
jgi:hypothetical protein